MLAFICAHRGFLLKACGRRVALPGYELMLRRTPSALLLRAQSIAKLAAVWVATCRGSSRHRVGRQQGNKELQYEYVFGASSKQQRSTSMQLCALREMLTILILSRAAEGAVASRRV